MVDAPGAWNQKAADSYCIRLSNPQVTVLGVADLGWEPTLCNEPCV